MLQPKKTKHRKMQKGKNRGLALRGSKVSFGEYGLKAVSRGRITARQIESARRALTRHIKRGGKVWIRIFPDVPITITGTMRCSKTDIVLLRVQGCPSNSGSINPPIEIPKYFLARNIRIKARRKFGVARPIKPINVRPWSPQLY